MSRKAAPKIYRRELVEHDLHPALLPIGNLVDSRHRRKPNTASKYLKELVRLGVLEEEKVGREKVFLHRKYLDVLFSDGHTFEPYLQCETDETQLRRHVQGRLMSDRVAAPRRRPRPHRGRGTSRQARSGFRPARRRHQDVRAGATSCPSSTPAIASLARTACRRPRPNGRPCASAIPASSCT